MVEHSHLAWRLLVNSRPAPPPSPTNAPPQADPRVLSYTPMLHSRLFSSSAPYQHQNFPRTLVPTSPLDGHPSHDRPLIAQFCSNSPPDLLSSAVQIAPYVDAIDLNLGCPQGIARKGNYGAFLQESWDLIHSLILTCSTSPDLPIPITAKIRVFESKQQTLEYARMVLSAGASILSVHGRTREQKGHNTGLASWPHIRHLRENLPPETVLFANGNILWPGDALRCLAETGADAVLSAEGCLYNPTGIFLDPTVHPPDDLFPRMDTIARRYLDILRERIIPFIPPPSTFSQTVPVKTPVLDPNLTNVKSHLFKLLHALLPRYPAIRAKLATSRPLHPYNDQNVDPLVHFEDVVRQVEETVAEHLKEHPEEILTNASKPLLHKVGDWRVPDGGWIGPPRRNPDRAQDGWSVPFYRCQPNLRPLPEEAVRRGAMVAIPGAKKDVDGADTVKI